MIDRSAIGETFDLASAQVCIDENRPEEAVKMAEAMLEVIPEDIDAKIILCQGLLRLGKLERLQMLLRDVDETICRLSRVYLRLGELCRKSGLHAEAENFLSKYGALTAVLTSDEGRETTELSMPSIEALDNEAIDEAQVDDISLEFLTVTLAELYMRQGHPDQAREVLKTILAKDPGNEQAAIKLTELAGTLTKTETGSDSSMVLPDEAVSDAALVAELESWLARVGRLRSPAS